MSRGEDLNLRPNAYEALALPLSYLGKLLERDTRIELAFPAWEADVLPLY